jgi:hypothetical protein
MQTTTTTPTLTITARGESLTLGAPSEEAAKLASVIIWRIERPKAKLTAQDLTHRETIARGESIAEKPRRGVSISTRRAAWNARPARDLSLHDKEDAAQEIFTEYLLGTHRKTDGIAEIFQKVRKLLRINNTRDDQSRAEEETILDALEHFAPLGAQDHRGSARRLHLASIARDLRARCFMRFASDTSRKRRAALRGHLSTAARLVTSVDPFAGFCPVVETDSSAWRMRTSALKTYAFGFNSIDAAMLAADMMAF